MYRFFVTARLTAMISVTNVNVTRDLSYAKVYVSIFAKDEEEKKSNFEALKNFSGKDTEYIADSAAEAVAEGKRPMDAMLIDGFSLADQAKEAENIIQSAIPEDIVDLVNKNVPVTLKNLKDVRNSRTDDSKIFIHRTDNAPINIVSAQRKLEEARLAMSAEANLSLLKKGISIDTKPIEELVDILKQHEKDYYSNLMTQNGVEPTVENINTFKSTMDVFEEMKTFPAYVINTETGNEDVSTVYTRGASLKTSMENANEIYETLMTAPRSDMGDDIKKAFKKQTGRTVMEAFSELKIEEAKKLITLGKPINEIADELSFCNKNYFSKVFKKVAGVTPSEYKKSL